MWFVSYRLKHKTVSLPTGFKALGLLSQPPILIGHRGVKGRCEENTLDSFQCAIDAKLAMIELDIHCTKDNHLVVIHDKDLDRTTTGEGPVSEHTRLEIEQLTTKEGRPIPFLGQVMDQLNGTITGLNIELKGIGSGPTLATYLTNRQDRPPLLISSFHYNELQDFREAMGDRVPPLGLLLCHPLPDDWLNLAADLHATSVNLAAGLLLEDLSLITQAQEQGLLVFAYTVNSKADFEILKQAQIHGVFTDDPQALSIHK